MLMPGLSNKQADRRARLMRGVLAGLVSAPSNAAEPSLPASVSVADIWGFRPDGGQTAAEMLLDLRRMVLDLYRVHGLDPASPLVVGLTSRTAGTLAQSVAEFGGVVTVTRTAP